MKRKLLGSWEIKKTNTSSGLKKVVISVTSIILGLIFAGLFVLLTGKNPLELYTEIVQSSVGSIYGLSETIVEMIPLALCSLGVSLAFRMQLWNIGAEGQFYMGAFGATYFALFFSGLPKLVLLPLMLLAGLICGGLWALIPALPKAFWNVNETISSLLLNYVAYLWIAYLVYGPWKDPKGNNFPLTKPFSDNGTIPVFGNTRISYALFLMFIIAVILFFILKHSKWGYEIRVSGSSRKAADYAGMSYIKNVLLVMFLSGSISGIAGMAEVSGVLHRLQQTISPGYGYTAILIALLARLNPISILLVSFLMGGLLVGGYSLQTSGFPSSMVSMFQGSILFFVLAGEMFNNYRLVRKKA
ncbi:beta-methylgalactoside transporter inner membrane component [Desulfosporosinus acididurans]|uniref:Beta-methylgalactoside transporter inner membrane component n=1 Tax=Desulfosporosinus acididurans TaxID=476652 RepID=A0A0J1FP51_9FIRM|nr:ABC transporter permease [Desulfosporosinus acididurans]KLU64738.1 beta-methylgalactoside transporter inner membrane component [Desulfosporosinus acididurans]